MPEAAVFSSSQRRWLVPAIGTIEGPRDSTHASASWAGVHRSASARRRSPATSSRLRGKLSSWKRGMRSLTSPSQKAAAERAVGDKADPELAADLEDAALDVPRQQRILDLHRRHPVGGVGAPNRLGSGFRNAQKAYLALAHQSTHRADRVLDRHGRIDPMNVVEVDTFGT